MGFVEVKCTVCMHRDKVDHYNMYTGHMYDATFTYVCPVCKGDMEEVEDGDELSDT
jgi:Zn finger protein HypA/HybF involved in hydrogenase expression